MDKHLAKTGVYVFQGRRGPFVTEGGSDLHGGGA